MTLSLSSIVVSDDYDNSDMHVVGGKPREFQSNNIIRTEKINICVTLRQKIIFVLLKPGNMNVALGINSFLGSASSLR